jgi:four helix bundle protein
MTTAGRVVISEEGTRLDVDAGPRGFKDLVAWQKADGLASAVYRSVRRLGADHRWLVDQTLRCAVSVPANIAEGHGRGSRAELLRFLDIARGSLSELEYYLHFMESESILDKVDLTALDAARKEAARVIYGLWRSLKAMEKSDWDHSGRTIREESETYIA